MRKQLSLFAAIAVVVTGISVPSFALTASATTSSTNLCIVSLSPSATETLYAIGAGKQVEAVDTDSDYPTTGLPTKRIDPFNPSAEAIATICKVTKAHPSSAPDLVVVAYDANSVVEDLTALGVPVITQDAPNDLSDVYSQMTTLGSRTGHVKAAAAIVTELKNIWKRDVAQIAPHPNKVVTMYWELDPTLYSLTSGTFIGSLLKRLGVRNVADAASSPSDYGYPQLSREYLISASPKLVFLADTICCGVNAKNFGQRPGFSTISAAVHHHVYGLNDDVASRWGPRLGKLMNALTSDVQKTLRDSKVWKKKTR